MEKLRQGAVVFFGVGNWDRRGSASVTGNILYDLRFLCFWCPILTFTLFYTEYSQAKCWLSSWFIFFSSVGYSRYEGMIFK